METRNAIIDDVSLNMENCGCLTLDLYLSGDGWGCCFGGYCLGHGYLGADHFDSSPYAMEAVMRIMDTIGVERLEELKGKIVRVRSDGLGSKVTSIGNALKDKWFSWDSFFKEKNMQE